MATPNKTQDPTTATQGDAPKSPAERDETPQDVVDNAQHRSNRRPIAQAHADVEAGIQDTERIGIPTNVPSSDDK